MSNENKNEMEWTNKWMDGWMGLVDFTVLLMHIMEICLRQHVAVHDDDDDGDDTILVWCIYHGMCFQNF